MKNFNIFGVHGKIRFKGVEVGVGVGHKKPIWNKGLPKKGTWTVCRFKGSLVRKGVFLTGVDTPMQTKVRDGDRKLT